VRYLLRKEGWEREELRRMDAGVGEKTGTISEMDE